MTGKAEEKEKIITTTPAALHEELSRLREALALTETEATWQKIDNALKRFLAVVRGGATGARTKEPDVMRDAFIKEWRSRDLVDKMIQCVLSERTRLSSSALDLITSTTRLVSAFVPFIDLYVPTICKLITRPNKIYVTRASATLHHIIRNTRLPQIIAHLSAGADDKSNSLRTAVSEGLWIFLGGERGTIGSLVEIKDLEGKNGKWLKEIEKIIKIGSTDKDPKVRQTIKKAFGLYCEGWPERAEEFSKPLTPITRRYLDISNKPASQQQQPLAASTFAKRPEPRPAGISEKARTASANAVPTTLAASVPASMPPITRPQMQDRPFSIHGPPMPIPGDNMGSLLAEMEKETGVAVKRPGREGEVTSKARPLTYHGDSRPEFAPSMTSAPLPKPQRVPPSQPRQKPLIDFDDPDLVAGDQHPHQKQNPLMELVDGYTSPTEEDFPGPSGAVPPLTARARRVLQADHDNKEKHPPSRPATSMAISRPGRTVSNSSHHSRSQSRSRPPSRESRNEDQQPQHQREQHYEEPIAPPAPPRAATSMARRVGRTAGGGGGGEGSKQAELGKARARRASPSRDRNNNPSKRARVDGDTERPRPASTMGQSFRPTHGDRPRSVSHQVGTSSSTTGRVTPSDTGSAPAGKAGPRRVVTTSDMKVGSMGPPPLPNAKRAGAGFKPSSSTSVSTKNAPATKARPAKINTKVDPASIPLPKSPIPGSSTSSRFGNGARNPRQPNPASIPLPPSPTRRVRSASVMSSASTTTAQTGSGVAPSARVPRERQKGGFAAATASSMAKKGPDITRKPSTKFTAPVKAAKKAAEKGQQQPATKVPEKASAADDVKPSRAPSADPVDRPKSRAASSRPPTRPATPARDSVERPRSRAASSRPPTRAVTPASTKGEQDEGAAKVQDQSQPPSRSVVPPRVDEQPRSDFNEPLQPAATQPVPPEYTPVQVPPPATAQAMAIARLTDVTSDGDVPTEMSYDVPLKGDEEPSTDSLEVGPTPSRSKENPTASRHRSPTGYTMSEKLGAMEQAGERNVLQEIHAT